MMQADQAVGNDAKARLVQLRREFDAAQTKFRAATTVP